MVTRSWVLACALTACGGGGVHRLPDAPLPPDAADSPDASAGDAAPFSEVAGAEGITFDTGGSYGGGLLASRPASGGYASDDTVSRIASDGLVTGALVSARPGVHAIALAPPGPFGGRLHAASWATGELVAIDPQGTVCSPAGCSSPTTTATSWRSRPTAACST